MIKYFIGLLCIGFLFSGCVNKGSVKVVQTNTGTSKYIFDAHTYYIVHPPVKGLGLNDIVFETLSNIETTKQDNVPLKIRLGNVTKILADNSLGGFIARIDKFSFLIDNQTYSPNRCEKAVIEGTLQLNYNRTYYTTCYFDEKHKEKLLEKLSQAKSVSYNISYIQTTGEGATPGEWDEIVCKLRFGDKYKECIRKRAIPEEKETYKSEWKIELSDSTQESLINYAKCVKNNNCK